LAAVTDQSTGGGRGGDDGDVREQGGRIHHLALADEWQAAVTRGGPYRRSTIGKSLEEVGFVHCSFAAQVQEIADLLYFARQDAVLLTIDVARVDASVVVENLHGTDQAYPHIYGPVPLDAVVHAVPVPLRPDGRLDIDAVLAWQA
jgi:glutathione S-transferase